MNQTIELLKNHKSIRKYKDTPISDDILETIVEAGQWASTSSFVQAYSVIRVNDKTSREKLYDWSGQQKNVLNAPEFLVFCADLNRIKVSCDQEETTMEDGFIEWLLIASVDVSLVAQNIMVAAESLGLGGVYVGGIRNEAEKVSQLLNLPDRVYAIYGLCLGYPDQDPEKKPRLPLNMILHDEVYKEVDIHALKSYDEAVESYYERRTKGKVIQTWTKQMSKRAGSENRPHMMKFLNDRKYANR